MSKNEKKPYEASQDQLRRYAERYKRFLQRHPHYFQWKEEERDAIERLWEKFDTGFEPELDQSKRTEPD